MPLSQKTKDTFDKINRFLERMIPVSTPLGIALGFIFPKVFIHLRPYVPLLFAMMTFSGALKLKAAELGSALRRPSPIILFFFISHIIMPIAALFSSSLFFENQDLSAGFVLLFAGPTAVSGFIWVMIYNGDKALALTLILLDTLLAPLVVPGTVSLLMGAKVAMDMTGIAVSLCLMVVVPTIIAVTLNETSRGKIPQAVCPVFDPFAKICLFFVIAANAAPLASSLSFKDTVIWKAAPVCIALTAGGFLAARLSGIIGRYGREKNISLFIACGLRNNSAVMTIAVTFFPEATAIPTLLSIIFQQTITAVLGKIFLKKKDTTL